MTAKEKVRLKAKIAASDARIKKAMETLAWHHRGRQVARNLADLLCGDAQGLDSQGLNALTILVQEFEDGRRDFCGQLRDLEGA